MSPPSGLADFPQNLQTALLGCAHGDLPPNVALMRMAMACRGRDELEQALAQAFAAFSAQGNREEAERLDAARTLWTTTPQAWETLRAVLAAVEKTGGVGIDDWARSFDQAAEISPLAGVALYSLGRADLLDAATAEIVERMRGWGLVGRDRLALEIGCGSGRFVRALSPHMRLVVGIDVSLGMLRAAAPQCRNLSGAALLRTTGRDLGVFKDGSFDLVYAIDSFPYLVEAGGDLAARHIAESRRVLKPGGVLLVMNYSYRGGRDGDRAEIARLSQAAGFALVEDDGQCLRHWDGEVYRLVLSRSR